MLRLPNQSPSWTGRTRLRTEGHAASEFANTTLHGEAVRLVFAPFADRRGSYGRLLAYVYLDGENINYRLLAEGYARVYDSEFSESERFYAAEADAQSAGIGIWTCRDPTSMDSTPQMTLVISSSRPSTRTPPAMTTRI